MHPRWRTAWGCRRYSTLWGATGGVHTALHIVGATVAGVPSLPCCSLADCHTTPTPPSLGGELWLRRSHLDDSLTPTTELQPCWRTASGCRPPRPMDCRAAPQAQPYIVAIANHTSLSTNPCQRRGSRGDFSLRRPPYPSPAARRKRRLTAEHRYRHDKKR